MMRKVLHGLLVMGAAAIISVGATSYAAEAAAPPVGNYTVDFTNQKINVVDTGKNTKIYVAKTTVTQRTDRKTQAVVTTVKKAAATEYDLAAAKATIDLSSYGVTKDVYLSIWGNKTTDPILVKLPAVKTKLKATVNALDTTVKVEDITDRKNPVDITSAGFQFCTTNGDWADYKLAAPKVAPTDLKAYTASGATLRFRMKATANKALPAAIEIGKDKEGVAVMASVANGSFAGNELKVKIPKTANGPKATIDYNTRTVKIPVTSEYRHQAPTAALGKFAAAPVPEGRAKIVSLSVDDLLTATGAEFDLRTAATDKKPASKITEYKLNPMGAIVGGAAKANPATLDVTRENAIKVGTAVQDIKVTKLTLNSRTMKGTMTIKNGTTDRYQVIVKDADGSATVGKLTLPTSSDRISGTIAAGKTAGIAVKSGQYVFIRKAADVKTQQWSTPYVYYGIVNNTLG